LHVCITQQQHLVPHPVHDNSDLHIARSIDNHAALHVIIYKCIYTAVMVVPAAPHL
jgi:hypothetical protein